ncbi:hypothetical protein [Amycolatopsis sp. DG1A-15b]|uniref:hypothetical protein n=1 Tax=Amycolatopsis sp. DG1A-15b TaxID=3052846 RepID=UPI00255BA4BC|nr:hypothetical protein [Amycolatopsis sp. DG1A-15b]WIX92161.1 hypothetical protein QRY02_17615 [Amycolatopsis sp. DG1A-15b]
MRGALSRMAFFGDQAPAIPTIALVNVRRHLGYTALLIFAGLQTSTRRRSRADRPEVNALFAP